MIGVLTDPMHRNNHRSAGNTKITFVTRIWRMELIQSIYETRQLLTFLQYQQWRGVLFAYQWWLLLLLLIIPWIAWWKLVDKARLFEILSYALIVVIIGTTLDMYGVKLGLWSYPIKIFYLNPGLITVVWGVLPVIKSLIYQSYPEWKQFTATLILISAIASFIGEPIFHWLGMYKLHKWNYIYSFLGYIPVGVVSKWIVDWLRKKSLLANS
jgi:hypothetical protein